MGSTVVLVFFSVFILAGFAIEARGRKNVTRAAWLPLLWMVICASRSVGQWLNLSASNTQGYLEATLSGSPVDQMVLGTAIVLGIIIIYKRKERVIGILKNNKALLALIIYLGITVFWSDIGEASFRRWVRLVGNFIMAAVLMTESNPLESVRSIFRRTAYLLIPLSVMLIKFFPQMGVMFSWNGTRDWTGVALQKNGLGHLCFVTSFFLVWDSISTWGKNVGRKLPWFRDYHYIPLGGNRKGIARTYMNLILAMLLSGLWHGARRGLFDMIIVMMCIWLLRGTGGVYSSSSIGCLVLGLAILIGSKVPAVKRNFGRLWVLVMSAACLFLVLEFSFGIVQLIVTGLGRDMTFTDRDIVWSAVLNMGMRRPLLGYGYGGFWTVERAEIARQETGLRFFQSHNGYLEIFVEGGLVAITLLGVLLISIFRKIQRGGVSNYKNAVFRFCFFVMILLANITESSFMRERALLTFVFFIIALDNKPFRKSSGGHNHLEASRGVS